MDKSRSNYVKYNIDIPNNIKSYFNSLNRGLLNLKDKLYDYQLKKKHIEVGSALNRYR